MKIISKFCFQVTVGANCVTCNLGLLQFLRQRLEAEGRGLANCLAPLGKNGCSIMFDHIDLGCQTGRLKGICSGWSGYNFATGRVVGFRAFFFSGQVEAEQCLRLKALAQHRLSGHHIAVNIQSGTQAD